MSEQPLSRAGRLGGLGCGFRPAPSRGAWLWPWLGLWLVWAGLLGGGCTPPPGPEAQAEAAYGANRPAEAVPHFERALAESAGADRPRLRARLGLARAKAGQSEAAEADLRSAIADPAVEPLIAARAQRYLANLYSRQGRTDEALAALTAAADHFARLPQATEDLLKTRQIEAGLRWQRGEADGAFDAYLDLHGRAQVAQQPTIQAAGLEGMGMVLAWAGDQAAAADLMQTACDLYRSADALDKLLACEANAAVVTTGAGDPAEGLAAAEAVIARARAAGRPPVEAQGQVTAAWALARLSRYPQARAMAATAEATATAAGLPRQVTQATVAALVAAAAQQDWAWFDAHAPRAAAALPPGDPAQTLLKALQVERASTEGAEVRRAALEASFAAYEARRELLDAGLMAAFLLPRRLAVYQGLLRHRLDDGDLAGALDVLGALKARSFSDRLRAGPSGPGRGLVPRSRVTRALTRARHDLRIPPQPPAQASLARLPPDLMVLEHAVIADEVLIFVSHRGQTRSLRVPAEAAAVEAASDAVVAALRAGAGWQQPAAALAALILDPALPALEAARAEGARRLAWLPHGPLHAIPLEALPWGEGLVIDHLPVFSASNLTALVAALDAPRRPAGERLLTVANALGDLPGAQVEARRLAGIYPQATGLYGPEAGLAAVRAAWGAQDVLHFAVHGVRPDAHTPAYLQLRDGALHAAEIASADLGAVRLAVLSVCDSARGRPNAGDEIIGVLDRAFLEAGVGAVVASRWPVHDAASVLFTERLHRAWRAGRPLLDAFHEAQLALRRGQLKPAALGSMLLAQLDQGRVRGVTPYRPGEAPQDFEHPYFWAAFSLRGDPR